MLAAFGPHVLADGRARAARIEAELGAERAGRIGARYAGVGGQEAVRLGLELVAGAGPPVTPTRPTSTTPVGVSAPPPEVDCPLTARERQVASMIARG